MSQEARAPDKTRGGLGFQRRERPGQHPGGRRIYMSAGPAAPSVNRFHLAPFQKALFEPRPTRRKYITTVNLFARRRGPLLMTRVRPSVRSQDTNLPNSSSRNWFYDLDGRYARCITSRCRHVDDIPRLLLLLLQLLVLLLFISLLYYHLILECSSLTVAVHRNNDFSDAGCYLFITSV